MGHAKQQMIEEMEQQEYEAWAREQEMEASEVAHMLDDLFERDVLQPVETGQPDYLQEAFAILEGEPGHVTPDHLRALARYFSAKLSIQAA